MQLFANKVFIHIILKHFQKPFHLVTIQSVEEHLHLVVGLDCFSVDDSQIVIHLILRFTESEAHESEPFFQIDVCVSLDSIATMFVQSGGIQIHLAGGHQIDKGLSCQLGGRHFVDRYVFGLSSFCVPDVTFPIDAAMFQ